MFISLDLPLARRISLFPNLGYYNRLLLLYALGISYLSSNTILDFRTTVPLCSSLCYCPVFLARTSLSVLEECANIVFALYTIRIC